MAGSALFALIALILGAMPPAMPDQVPELMHRAILPVTVDAPTCIAVTDRPVGETDQLLVGLANGTINVFHASGSKMIVRIFELESGHAIDDLCAVRLPGTGINFAFLARQGRTLSVMGEETSQVRGRLSLPSPNGRYEFTRVAAKLEKRASGHSHERVLLHDDLNVFEITLDAVGQRWRITLVPVVSDCNGVVVHELSDRAIIVTGSHSILDFTAEEGAAEPVSFGLSRASVDGGSNRSTARNVAAVVPNSLVASGDSLSVLSMGGDSLWTRHVVALRDSLTIAITVRDSMLLLGGNLTVDPARNVGWLSLIGPRGDVIASEEHGRPVAKVVEVGAWLAVQGENRNLSLYDFELRPLWDTASQVAPLAIAAAHIDADDSEDLIVVGTRTFSVSNDRVVAIREILNRPGFMKDAAIRGNFSELDRPMLTVFYSNAGELRKILTERMRLAGDLERSREFVEAAGNVMTARAAAATIGDRETVLRLGEIAAHLIAIPKRERATLLAATILLIVGVWVAATSFREDSWRRGASLTMIAFYLGAGGAVAWRLLGGVLWSPVLLAGAGVVGGSAALVQLRGQVEPEVRRVPGAPIEELALRIAEFTHGGDGSSNKGRRKLTTIAYLAQEMLDSADDPEHYHLLLERLELRYKSFYPAKYELTRELPKHAIAAGVAVDEAEVVARSAGRLHEAMMICLSDNASPDQLAPALADVLAAREELKVAADEAEEIVQRNPGCSVLSCVTRVIDEKRELLDESKITVQTDLGLGRSDDAVAISRVHLQFIIENLVTNAIRSMESTRRRRLSFEGRIGRSRYEFRVSDTGCGIPDETLHTLFIPSDSDEVMGGVGLPHSRELLRRLGGNIVVESTGTGEGTTFLVTLRFWAPE